MTVDADAERVPVRQRDADDVVRAGQGPGQADVPPQRTAACRPSSGSSRCARSGRVWWRSRCSPAAAASDEQLVPCASGCATTSCPRTVFRSASRPPSSRPTRRTSRTRAGDLAPEAALLRLQAGERTIQQAQAAVGVCGRRARPWSCTRGWSTSTSLNVAFAHQTALLAGYQGAAEAALAPLDRENRRLARALKRSKTPAGQAAALSRFAGSVSDVLATCARSRCRACCGSATAIRSAAWTPRACSRCACGPRCRTPTRSGSPGS